MRLMLARAALKRLLDEPTAIRPAASLAAALNPELAGGSTAIRAAVDAAHSAGEKGGAAQVLVQRANTEFRTEWTYGHDPYPAPG